MPNGKNIVKTLVRVTCSPWIQHQIRSFYVTRQVIRDSVIDEAESPLLKVLLSPGDFVADIGANVGRYTKYLSALVGASGHVYAFEPITANYEILQRVIRKASLTNVNTFQAALSTTPGQCKMVIPAMKHFGGYYWARFAEPNDTGQVELVTTLALDDLWQTARIPRLDFVKCDVEGAELAVIDGGRKLTMSMLPGWLVEIGRRASSDVFALLKGIGYRPFVYKGRLVHTDDYRDKEFSNYFFFHPSSKLWPRVVPYLSS